MKKALIILGLFLAVAFSCSKSDEGPTYSQAKLSGTWENRVNDENGCRDQLVIATDSMFEKTICSMGNYYNITTAYYENYSFDGKKISVSFLGINAVYVINELTDSTLVAILNVSGTNKKEEYKKVK
jgi:hypothetical protein